MIAAASVNWHYLLVLIVPSLFVIVFTALTWYSRSRRPPGGSNGPRGSGGRPAGKGGKSSASGGKSSASTGKRSGPGAKRRRT